MAQNYAKNQPAGFKNHIENVAIVGVCFLLSSLSSPLSAQCLTPCQ